MILHNERLFFLSSGEFIILRDLHGEIGELLNYSPSILGRATSPSVENMQRYLGWKPCSTWVHSVLLLKKIVMKHHHFQYCPSIWLSELVDVVFSFPKLGWYQSFLWKQQQFWQAHGSIFLGDSDWSGEYMTLQRYTPRHLQIPN